MKKQSEKAKMRRYEAALLEVLGQSWRKWWLDRPSTDRINRKNVESTHRKKLERMEKNSKPPLRHVDHNRRAEKSFKHCRKYFSYALSLLLICFILFVSFLGRIVLWVIGTETSDTFEWAHIGTFVILVSACLHLIWLMISISYPTDTTQYVGAEWRDFRDFLRSSGLAEGVTKQLILHQSPDFIEELEYCAERAVIDTEVSNAIHHAYREYLLALLVEEIRSNFKRVLILLNNSGSKSIALGIFESQLGPLINVAPIFFVPHGTKDFRLILYPEAFERLKPE